MQTKNIEFVVPAAGQSSRNYPHSKGIPHKSLVPFGSKKIIDHIMSEIIQAGGKHITFVVSDENAMRSFKDCFKREKEVEEKFKRTNNILGLEILQSNYIPEDIELKYIIQQEPKGLAHAIGTAALQSPNKHLAILLPDDIIITHDGISIVKKVVDKYITDNIGGNLFLTRQVDDISRWGIIENGIFLEKPKTSSSREAANMFFILDQSIGTILANAAIKADTAGTKEYQQWERKKELHHSTYINEAVKQNPNKMKIRTYKVHEKDLFLDCGTLHGYEKALLYALLTTSIHKKENRAFLREHFTT
jgi:UTP-glucose-1-phosphate uridylyltransferase